jgi:hypothetical protein
MVPISKYVKRKIKINKYFEPIAALHLPLFHIAANQKMPRILLPTHAN